MTININKKISGSAKVNYKGYDYGISAGLGFHYELNQDLRISSQIRYNYGIASIERGYYENYDYHSVNLRFISFLIGITYKL